jgi:MFS family permease
MSRAGQLDCVCGPLVEDSTRNRFDGWRLTLGFALAVLAQALTLAALPVAGARLAPHPVLAYLPYALTLLGAAIASFPASLLLYQFGRRAAFGLGATLGTAGGLLSASAIVTQQFGALCLGALWIGIAQGFALFYRHAAASARAGGSRAALTALAGGCGASVLAPGCIALCQTFYGPLADVALMLAIGIISFAALPLLLTLPHRLIEFDGPTLTQTGGSNFWPATAVAAASWFVMARAMAGAPTALIGCGLGASAVGGLVAWHLIAMYGPIALASRFATPTAPAIASGAAMLALAAFAPRSGSGQIELLLLMAGVGWSLVQIGVSRLLYDGARRSRLALGLHDTVILGAALIGALSAGI